MSIKIRTFPNICGCDFWFQVKKIFAVLGMMISLFMGGVVQKLAIF